LDAETLCPLIAVNPDITLVIPEANRAFVADRLGCDRQWPVGLNDGESTTVGGIQVHAVPAAHNEIDRDETGRCRYLGYVVRLGALTVYHSGDTMMYDGMSDGLKSFNIDVAILPINGCKPERRVSGNLFGDEAAHLAHAIGARMVIPCHYDMFTFNTETPELFVRTCQELNQPHRVLRCGERFCCLGF
jgi:L-ascorbate metabolism protein UlaG (beta-lactamase superfamily)